MRSSVTKYLRVNTELADAFHDTLYYPQIVVLYKINTCTITIAYTYYKRSTVNFTLK
jgi:hypothetical protein